MVKIMKDWNNVNIYIVSSLYDCEKQPVFTVEDTPEVAKDEIDEQIYDYMEDNYEGVKIEELGDYLYDAMDRAHGIEKKEAEVVERFKKMKIRIVSEEATPRYIAIAPLKGGASMGKFYTH